jgi:hypothetical protein
MKIKTLLTAVIIVQHMVGLSLQAADQLTKLSARSGSKMRIEGTSTVHDWQAESKIIGGLIEVSPNFPTTPGQEVKPEKVQIDGMAKIGVRSLFSVKKDGSHNDDKMDKQMWEKLKLNEHPTIFYYPGELTLKEAPKSKDAPYVFDSKGQVVAAGVTNEVSMPVNVLPMADNKIKISGILNTKMSAFNIKLDFLGGLFKAGDDIKLIFDWVVGPVPVKPAAAAVGK